MEFIINPDGGSGARGKAGEGASADLVKDGNSAGFAVDVIEASAKVPVIVDFWAPWCEPCKQLGPAIEKLVRKAGGLVRLVKINIDENQDLATQMRVQSIPAVYAFKGGQPVDAFVGALPESQIRAFIDRLLGGAKPPMEQAIDTALDEAAEALRRGDTAAAAAVYREILGENPSNEGAAAGLIRALTAVGEWEQAHAFVDGLERTVKSKPEVTAAIAAMELAEEGGGQVDMEDMRARLAAEPDDHRARYDLATALFASTETEAAMEELLELVRRDREWDDQAARKRLVRIFAALGAQHPLTVSGRRRLSSILFS